MKPDMQKVAEWVGLNGLTARVVNGEVRVRDETYGSIAAVDYRYDPLTNDAQAFELLLKLIDSGWEFFKSSDEKHYCLWEYKGETICNSDARQAIVNTALAMIQEEG